MTYSTKMSPAGRNNMLKKKRWKSTARGQTSVRRDSRLPVVSCLVSDTYRYNTSAFPTCLHITRLSRRWTSARLSQRVTRSRDNIRARGFCIVEIKGGALTLTPPLESQPAQRIYSCSSRGVETPGSQPALCSLASDGKTLVRLLKLSDASDTAKNTRHGFLFIRLFCRNNWPTLCWW